ncbi:hypothetical protein EMCRGX_G003963 [Ephydatia muelleri]
MNNFRTWCTRRTCNEICDISYRRCIANNNKTFLSTSPVLIRNNPIAVFLSGPAFCILLLAQTAVISESRSPAIWFAPGTTRLVYSIGDSTNGNWVVDTTAALPLNSRTNVTLECKGNDVKLTVGEKVYTATQPTYRYSGNLIVYASDPWYQAAKAVISNLDYKILPAAGASIPQRRYIHDDG